MSPSGTKRRLFNSAPNLFAEIRKNICGKTCAYFPKYVYVFAEIRLRFCGNKFEKTKMRAFRGSLKKKCAVQQSKFADKIKKLVRQHDEVFTAYVFSSWFLTKTLHTLINS